MLRAALDAVQAPMLFADLDPLAHCICCGRRRPRELVGAWLCSVCREKPLWNFVCAVRAKLA